MAGKAQAVKSGDELVQQVKGLATSLGLKVRTQFKVGRRIWGAARKIDIVLVDENTRKMLGVECKFQSVGGTAEEKIPATIQDMAAWPIPGLVVFAGEGFTRNMDDYLTSTGKAVRLDELEPWLRLFFGLPLENNSQD